MARISKAYLTNRFARVAAAMAWDVEGSAWYTGTDGRNRAYVGHVSLEHNSIYGWSVNKIVNEAGAERRLCGSCKAAELDAWFEGILFAKGA